MGVSQDLITTPAMLFSVLFYVLALFSWSHCSKQPDFKQWSSVYLPDLTQDELDAIYPTWKKNAELVSAHNKQNNQFTMTLNKFAHLTPDQVPKIPPLFTPPLEPEAYYHRRLTERAPPPDSFDWRDHNVITPVHDQGTLGCSDPLVLADAISSLHAFVSKDLVQFSYKQLLDCCWLCNCSGLVNISYHCITKLNLCPTAQYPSQPASQCKCLHETCDFHIAGAWIIPPGGEVGLVTAVLISPIMATIDASLPSFQFYKSGIYSSKMCSSTHIDHTVFLVGYGENDKGKYWLCKNSWGVDWGMDGYFLLARDQDNMCGIAAQASYLYV